MHLYPCDLLFVHRDAEGQDPRSRVAEIQRALEDAGLDEYPGVCVVPVRMTEAWFLFDETAIREAAGNPRGTQSLTLPNLATVEAETDPKERLYTALREASGLTRRRLRKFSPAGALHRVAELIADYSPLRRLSAFAALEDDILRILDSLDNG